MSELREIHCRIPSKELAVDFDFEELRPELRETLDKVIWHVEDWKNVSLGSIKFLLK